MLTAFAVQAGLIIAPPRNHDARSFSSHGFAHCQRSQEDQRCLPGFWAITSMFHEARRRRQARYSRTINRFLQAAAPIIMTLVRTELITAVSHLLETSSIETSGGRFLGVFLVHINQLLAQRDEPVQSAEWTFFTADNQQMGAAKIPQRAAQIQRSRLWHVRQIGDHHQSWWLWWRWRMIHATEIIRDSWSYQPTVLSGIPNFYDMQVLWGYRWWCSTKHSALTAKRCNWICFAQSLLKSSDSH